MVERVLIMGAGGRDFHNFNLCYRNNQRYQVMGFTATQIPDIEGRRYPSELSGERYPRGLPIWPESALPDLIREQSVDQVVFSYSDVPYTQVMSKAAQAAAAGADFIILGTSSTMLRSSRPVIAVCAVRTGCGKSQTSRAIYGILAKHDLHAVLVRHPMAYGDLAGQAVQRFASFEDLNREACTLEEREEFEPILEMGGVVFAGVDYEKVLRRAEQEAELIIWDGGNNDTPFFQPDVHVVVFDPHRPGHERSYFPGQTNLLMADIAVIGKVNTAETNAVEEVQRSIASANPEAQIVLAESKIEVDGGERIRGKRVLVIEDGPSVTHGEMASGAGMIAANRYGAAEIVDPRPFLRGRLKKLVSASSHIGPVLPAIGYSPAQMAELRETIEAVPCDLIVVATPVDLGRVLVLDRPAVRVTYDYKDHGQPSLEEALLAALRERNVWGLRI